MTIRAELDGRVILVPARRARLATSPFEVAIGLAGVLVGAASIVSRYAIETSNLNAVIPLVWVYVINGGYLASGALILAGVWRGRRHLERAGLIAQAFFLAVALAVIIDLRGLAALTSIILYVALIGASVVRSYIVTHYQHLVALFPPPYDDEHGRADRAERDAS